MRCLIPQVRPHGTGSPSGSGQVLSFPYLAGSKASPEFAHGFLEKVAGRLRRTGYNVWLTPFGYVCEWELSVYGESLAKVFKEI